MTNYATASELKVLLGETADQLNEAVLDRLLEAATEVIDTHTNREESGGFLADSSVSTRLYTGGGHPIVRIDECVEITLVEMKLSVTSTTWTALAANDWYAFRGEPRRPNFNALPKTFLAMEPAGNYSVFTSGEHSRARGFSPVEDSGGTHWKANAFVGNSAPTVRVTAKWGYAVEVPAKVREASIIMASRWYKRGETAWSDSIMDGDFGQMQFRKKIDPDVEKMLERYVVPVI